MVYKAIGLMSGSSLDGLDIAYVHFQETGGKWSMAIQQTACYPYSPDWIQRLQQATQLPAWEYQLLHADYGHYLGQAVNRFIEEHGLEHKVDMVASHGHTSFHLPHRGMTHQLGDGAAIAAETGLPVISDLRTLDVAFGGQGAPIVPIGEKLLLADYGFLLNIGGIANLSFRSGERYYGYDVCPANRVLNLLVQPYGLQMDAGGALASRGMVQQDLLAALDKLEYYGLPYPKSLANDFGTDLVFPLITDYGLSVEDALHSYSEHIALRVAQDLLVIADREGLPLAGQQMLVTGGGALNNWLVSRLIAQLQPLGVTVVVPEPQLVNFKEAVIMALIGVLRWREETNVLSSVTGAKRDSVGGALWLGGEP